MHPGRPWEGQALHAITRCPLGNRLVFPAKLGIGCLKATKMAGFAQPDFASGRKGMERQAMGKASDCSTGQARRLSAQPQEHRGHL
jgi:hypothetical protein